jgi:hypothetical protein
MKNSAIQVALPHLTICLLTAEEEPLVEHSTMTDFLHIVYRPTFV